MPTMQQLQERYDNLAEPESIDHLADTINQALDELRMCRDRLARASAGWNTDERQHVASWVREIASWMKDARA